MVPDLSLYADAMVFVRYKEQGWAVRIRWFIAGVLGFGGVLDGGLRRTVGTRVGTRL